MNLHFCVKQAGRRLDACYRSHRTAEEIYPVSSRTHLGVLGTFTPEQEIHKLVSKEIYFMCMNTVSMYVFYMYHMHTWCQERAKEVIGFSGIGVLIVVSCSVVAGNQT